MQSTLRADTEWPDYISLHFQGVGGAGTVESRYYGPYNTLLSYIMGRPDKYQVAPQTSMVRVGRDAVDFVLWYIVTDSADKVVMVVEVKDGASANSPERRLSADVQMRYRFNTLVGRPATERVYGISALGTGIRTYMLDRPTRLITPGAVRRPDEDHVLPGDFLAGWWDMDVLSQVAFDRLRLVMEDIDSMCP